MKKPYAKFYLGLLIPTLLFAAYFVSAARLLANAGEYLTMDATIDRISDTYGYYGSALNQRTFFFKERLYRRIKPDVAVLGSSRVLQFRGESFSGSFVNIGGMSGLDDTIEIAHDLFNEHAPKLLILGVDFWWFNPANENARPLRSPENAAMSVSDLLKPPGWLVTGKMSPQQAGDIMSGDVPDVGISAILRKDGFDRAGAYYYTSQWLGERESDDLDFSVSFGRIKKGSGVFVHGTDVSAPQMKKFEKMLDELTKRNIHIILFLPPFAPSVLDAMANLPEYKYMKSAEAAVKSIAARRKLLIFDFHDARSFGSSDCEFTDGIHAGQIATDRMLLRLAIGDTYVRKVARLPETALEITRHGGHASNVAGETDFLGLKCIK